MTVVEGTFGAAVMVFASILFLGFVAALNLSARVNDAVRIIAPEPGIVRTKLLSQVRWMIGLLTTVSAVVVFIYSAYHEINPNWLIVTGFSILLAGILSVLAIIWQFSGRTLDLSPLFLDRIARSIAVYIHVDSGSFMLFCRVAAAMIKVIVFFLAVTAIFR